MQVHGDIWTMTCCVSIILTTRRTISCRWSRPPRAWRERHPLPQGTQYWAFFSESSWMVPCSWLPRAQRWEKWWEGQINVDELAWNTQGSAISPSRGTFWCFSVRRCRSDLAPWSPGCFNPCLRSMWVHLLHASPFLHKAQGFIVVKFHEVTWSFF